MIILIIKLGQFQSTPSVWRVTVATVTQDAQAHIISIHTLRVEGDNKDLYDRGTVVKISIHTLRVEGDI